MVSMEDYNYWGDRRTLNGMVNRGKIDGEYLIVDTGEDEPLKLQTKFGVCPTCGGRGRHTNPSIDCCGITADEFHEDPDFAEEYFRGDYDVTCSECNGLRVVPEVDRKNNKKEDLAAYDAYIQSEWDYAQEVAAERRMGC